MAILIAMPGLWYSWELQKAETARKFQPIHKFIDDLPSKFPWER